MADAIVCSVCGESNPADMEFCRNCQSRLRPLPGSLQSESGPIQPGALPTKKVTSELEPLLPQWLRDARQQARDTLAEDATRAEQQQKEQPPAPGSDLLDGLASQRDEEDEEVPDWLAQITGAKSKKKKPAPEESQVKWVELGREPQQPATDEGPAAQPEQQAPKPRAAEGDALSDWFKQAAASSETADFRMPPAPMEGAPEAPQPEPEPQRPVEDLSWLTSLDAGSASPPHSPAQTAPLSRTEVPDWLKKMEAENPPPPPPPAAPTAPLSQADLPDWLKRIEEAAPTPPAAVPAEPAAPVPPPAEPVIPDWLKGLTSTPASEVEPPASEPPPAEPLIPTELPDWLSSLPSQPETPQQPEAEPPATEGAPAEPAVAAELPDWLSSLSSQPETPQPPRPEPPTEQPAEPPAVLAELPDWISALPAQQQPSSEPAPAADEALFSMDLPDWLSALPSQAEAQQPQEPEAAPEAAAAPSALPDWIASLGAAQPPAIEQPGLAEAEPAPAAPEVPPAVQEPPAAAPTPEAVPSEDVDAVFASMRTPDWLAAVLPPGESSATENAPAAQAAEEAIVPAELPSWVQAMRPVESAMGEGAGAEQEVSTEKLGPLAGLHGVLPTIPGAAEPSSKPKAHSIKLSASEQQLAHAALLERILAAETAPIPLKTAGVLRSQRILRWIITAVFLLALGAIVFSGTEIFALPSGVPNESIAAITAVEAIPADAPVLVVFDYQPSTVGEMEAAAGPLLDHLLVLNHPRLALLSTSPTGSALAERFMSTVLSGRGYVRDQQYVDLGYLPGGLAGVYTFAQNPGATVPLDARLRPVWQSSFLASVSRLSDFAATIVLTDSLESGRAWIEQTALVRGKSPMVLVASAQAGPMLLPYVDSGQVSGMVSGIYGAVGVEQRNAGSPGLVRRYWDAYSTGLYLALALIALGALWNLWLGIQDRRAQVVG